jgi:hypothetical protein
LIPVASVICSMVSPKPLAFLGVRVFAILFILNQNHYY